MQEELDRLQHPHSSVNKAQDYNNESDCPDAFWIVFAPTTAK